MPTTLLKTIDIEAERTPAPNMAEARPVNNYARFLTKPEVLGRVGASYPSIWQWMREGKFPRSRELGGRAVWIESEIEQWIVNRPIRRLKGDR